MNILIVLTDEQRYDTIAAAGHRHMITPHLDQLAEEGCIFDCAYSSNPICIPARHDLMTGTTARVHGYWSNSSSPISNYGTPTLPRVMSEAGFRTVAIGKMHHKPVRMHHGFAEMRLMEELPTHRADDQYATYLAHHGLEELQNIHGIRPLIYWIPQRSQMSERHHPNNWVADESIRWLEENGDAPFFMMASWIHPHPPLALPEGYAEQYTNRHLPPVIPVSRASYLMDSYASEWFGDNEDPVRLRKTREAYFGAITMVDRNAGRLIEYLRTTDKLDDTLVIFTSDHGEMLGDRGYFHKSRPYEQASRVPLIVRYPKWFRAGTRSTEIVSLLDIFPTCLDAAGIDLSDPEGTRAGVSINPETEREKRSTITISGGGNGSQRWIMHRTGSLKYVYNYAGGTEELYDLGADPDEQTNLASGSADVPHDLRGSLRSIAFNYELRWGPPILTRDGNLAALPENRHDELVYGGKYAPSLNSHFQYFNDQSPTERGARFRKEWLHALSDHEYSRFAIGDTFRNRAFLSDLVARYRAYAGPTPCEDIFGTDGIL